jgi:endonuclease/exonuclease/phosphatase family metal-dependent hydrolase
VDRLRVATLNILNLADRWSERQSLIYAEMAALQPDLLALQEVVYVMQQDRLIGAAGEGRYDAIRGWAGRPEYGNAILVREPLTVDEYDRVDLGRNRSAHRISLRLPGGARIIAAVTHLHHPPAAAPERDEQVAGLLDWIGAAPTADGLVVMGDFNADPSEAAYRRMAGAGFRSAHVEANGSEPSVTWPSGLQAPAMDADGEPRCVDYIWLRGAIRAEQCGLAFDRPAVDDRTLYPSDHFGLAARLVVG